MKKFIIILFLPILLNCQSILLRDVPQYGWAVDANGSDEYASKVNPINMDLNGSQRCSTQTDMDYETSIGNWTDTGDPVIEQSNTYKHAGSYAMKVTTTTAGDGTTNYFELASTNFTPLVSGEKYTIEAWGNGTGILGSDLLNGWDFTSGWSVAGAATINDNNTFTTTAFGGIYKQSQFNLGATYKITIEGVTTASSLSIRDAGAGGTYKTVSGSFNTSFYFIMAGDRQIYLQNAGAGQTDITSFTMQLVTLPSITLVCGSQSYTKTNISCVPGTFTKVVWNFQATANEVGQPIRAYLNQADAGFYFDDFSVKKSYDRAKLVWFKTSNTGANKMLVERYASSNGLKLSITTGNVLTAVIGDGTNTVTCTGTTNVCDGLWHLAGVKADRIGNMQLYLDGVVEGTAQSISGVGSIVSTTTLQIGYLSADYFNGQIGDTQLSRFDDVNASNLNFLTAKRNGIPRTFIGGNALTVGLYKWKGSTLTDKAKDWSMTGNDVTFTNLDLTDFVRATFPSK